MHDNVGKAYKLLLHVSSPFSARIIIYAIATNVKENLKIPLESRKIMIFHKNTGGLPCMLWISHKSFYIL
jgi:hypothetical protein